MPDKFNSNATPTIDHSIYTYIHKGRMRFDMQKFSEYKNLKSGFRNLDKITSLYPGLYVIGAISSLGKTTFCHQLCDQLAEAGRPVIFFSLEQSMLEMATKGISRMTARMSVDDSNHIAVTALDIRNGDINDTTVNDAMIKYADIGKNIHMIECGFDTTIGSIKDHVDNFIKNHPEKKPVVIVDYLQILQPDAAVKSSKEMVDSHVRELKLLQRDNDLVMIVICSLNRQNYSTPIDFESFKESGGIEYTADVVWGLQLQVITKENFASMEVTKKREAIKEAKLEQPRKIELVCLKNRYGKSSYSIKFNYYSAYDFYVPGNVEISSFRQMQCDEDTPYNVN